MSIALIEAIQSNQPSNPFAINGYGEAKDAFDPNSTIMQSLSSLNLDASDLDIARRSALTSYFTPEFLVRPMYRMAQRLGVKGRLLEPSCGNGRFVNYGVKSGFDVTAVEMDSIMGRIARINNPEADIRISQRFEEAHLTEGEYSLVIGNPPFGDLKPHTMNKRYDGLNILSYFIYRGLEMLHMNGYEIVLASTWFMDSKLTHAREKVSQLGELALALRLPNGCFSQEGTNIPVDLLVFKKNPTARYTSKILTESLDNSDWLNVETIEQSGKETQINEFFVNNPEFVLGEVKPCDHFYQSCDVVSTATLEQLEDKINELTDRFLVENEFADSEKLAMPSVRFECSREALCYRFNETFYVKGEVTAEPQIKQCKSTIKDCDGVNTAIVDILPVPASRIQVFKQYLEIKELYFALINAELDNTTCDLEEMRTLLNGAYELFVNKYGYINNPRNRRLLKVCSQFPRIAALEKNYEEADKETATVESCEKATLLTKRVFFPPSKPTKADTKEEAVIISLMEHGKINLPRIASLLNQTEEAATKALLDQKLIYKTSDNTYEFCVTYLSGNIREKIDELPESSEYLVNLQDLTKKLPNPVAATDISLPLGARWVPIEYYRQFINELLQCGDKCRLVYTDRYELREHGYIGTENTTIFGTDRKSATEIFVTLLNGRSPVVRDALPSGGYEINQAETALASAKAEEMKELFAEWIFSDIDRRTVLEDKYNSLFNVYSKPELSAFTQYLYVDGCALKPYDYQLEAAFFAMLNDSSMLDMVVGSGKTLSYQLFIQMMKKIFPETRVVVTMPNALIGQFASEYMGNFPQSNIIVVDNELPKEKREEILMTAVNSDFDCLLLPQSTFTALEAPTDTQAEIVQLMLEDLETAIESGEAERFAIKRLENKKENLEYKLKSLMHKTVSNQVVTFDDLRPTVCIIDEAQIVKNLEYSTTFNGIRGMGNPQGSQVAFDAFVKTRSVLNNERGKVVFGSGTVLTNTVLELVTWFRMLGSHLKHTGIHNVDEFITLFSQPVTDFSIDATGRGFKQFTSLKRFTNLPELSQMYATFSYHLSKEELHKRLPPLADGRPRIPPVAGGKIETVVLDISPEQETIFESLVEDAGKLTKERNMLAIMHDARCASLDQRLFEPSLEESPNNVINTVVDRVCEIRNEQLKKGNKTNQLIFCDTGISSRHRASEKKFINQLFKSAERGDLDAIAQIAGRSKDELYGVISDSFSVYDELERKLQEKGLNVAVIHDFCQTRAKRNKLQKDFNAGLIDVLIGSSIRMGAGWNLNKGGLVALHNMDLPQVPGMLEQRFGRILRQGNTLYEAGFIDSVHVLMYNTKKTLDSWSADLLDRKSKLFSAFASAQTERELEMVEDLIKLDELTAIIADNPEMLERVKLAHDINVTRMKKRSFTNKLHGYQRKHKDMKESAPRLLKAISNAKEDIKAAEREQVFCFSDGTPVLSDKSRFNSLLSKSRTMGLKVRGEQMILAQSQDFKLVAVEKMFYVSLVLVGRGYYELSVNGNSKAKGIIAAAEYTLSRLPEYDKQYFNRFCNLQRELKSVLIELDKKFDDNGLNDKLNRLAELDALLAA
ncbi:hypothetical protein HUO09_17670 [Vibrio sp. Y2-5]|uniref:helicase-related protein n=1 Tax=Vibrio sp. Y2-5 TaxID=2743977 RepID=UPI00166188EC|nr:helicase-related protein [Vibrio sp. Y2-5]MBD0788187.1 hypothetical protein [Vibrio sp. Y2-5]